MGSGEGETDLDKQNGMGKSSKRTYKEIKEHSLGIETGAMCSLRTKNTLENANFIFSAEAATEEFHIQSYLLLSLYEEPKWRGCRQNRYW